MYSYLHNSIRPIVDFVYTTFTSLTAGTAFNPSAPFHEYFLESGTHQILLFISFVIYALCIILPIYFAWRVFKYALRRFGL